MAIFQPTNIIPSSFTQGTVDVNDPMEVSWQVNGNSAMTAFQIDFYLNDANSTPVSEGSTGKITADNLPSGSSPLPFYGTDRFGNLQYFKYNAGTTWKDKGLNNGNNYKLKITQYYNYIGGNNYTLNLNISLLQGERYYFSLYNLEGATTYVSFVSQNSLPASLGAYIEYNSTTKRGWIISDGGGRSFTGEESTTVPAGENLGVAVNEAAVVQTSSSQFTTRDKPTLAIVLSNISYSSETPFPDTQGNFNASIGFFKAKYQQLQGDPVRWIRWQVATANNSVVGEILADTGDIYTPTLNYEFNGFFNGRGYAIRALCESESGQQADTGWIFFTIKIENQGRYDGDFTAQCLHKENVTLLQWEGVAVIPPTVSPENYEPIITSGSVTLPAKNTETGEEYSVTWNKELNSQGEEVSMNFPAPWTAVLKEKIGWEFTELSSFSFGSNPIGTTIYNGKQYWYYEYAEVVNSPINNILKIDVSPYSSELYKTEVMESEYSKNRSIVKVTVLSEEYVNLGAAVKVFSGTLKTPTNKIFSISQDSQGEQIVVSAQSSSIQNTSDFPNNFIANLGNQNYVIPIKTAVDNVAIIILNNSISVYFYQAGKVSDFYVMSTQNHNQPISSISIYGGDSGTTVDSVSIYKGDGSNILPLYREPNFEPVWNNPNYDLYMTANFNGNLEGGTGTTSGRGFRVYRQEIGKNYLTPIATVPSTVTSVKDYGISSRKAYKYSLHAYDINGAFMSAVEAGNVIATNFKNYSLLVCDYDEANDEYHVRKQYLFALNLSTGSVSNNNKPTLNANFTPYPTRMGDTANYASGTLQGLIGAIYTVPALIEQIGNYKRTTKPSTMDYFDSVDLEKELYDLSVTPYTLFLRDMKGHLRMIATSGAISMTTNIKQRQQSISISFPWVEVGDASDVTIIQTPDDYGWNNDNQVLDVQLDVDVETGELSATYPFPYNGTKFYLTGANKENLTAKTPLGVTPAKFNLSDVAEEPDDGEVIATVTVNTENN